MNELRLLTDKQGIEDLKQGHLPYFCKSWSGCLGDMRFIKIVECSPPYSVVASGDGERGRGHSVWFKGSYLDESDTDGHLVAMFYDKYYINSEVEAKRFASEKNKEFWLKGSK